MDRKDLKIQALLEKVSSLTTNYENQVADLRVDLTLVSQEKDALQDQLRETIAELEALRATVVEEDTTAVED